MFGSEVLEVGLGMALLFLFMSLIATAAQEGIEALLQFRGKDLEKGLGELLHSPEAVKAFYNHPLIFSLYRGNGYEDVRGGRKLPSYIPKESFASAMLDLVAKGGIAAEEAAREAQNAFRRPSSPAAIAAGEIAREQAAKDIGDVAKDSGGDARTALVPPGTSPTATMPFAALEALRFSELRATADKIQSPMLKQAVLALIDDADGSLSKLRENLESWYDGTMDRVAGWYKRRSQGILFFLGLAAAIVLNVDAITVAQRLSRDKSLRDSIVSYAEQKLPDLAKAAGAPPEGQGAGRPRESDVAERRSGQTAKQAEPPAGARSLPPVQEGGAAENAAETHGTEAAGGAAAPANAPAASGAAQTGTAADDPRAAIRGLTEQIVAIGYPIGWVDRRDQPRAYLVGKPKDLEEKDHLRRVEKDRLSRLPELSLAQLVPAPQACEPPRDKVFPSPCEYRMSAGKWLKAALGWLITALAIMLGAPFWFDVLNKFMVIRSTVKPKEKSGVEGSEDRTALSKRAAINLVVKQA